jgi:DNA polymerase-1
VLIISADKDLMQLIGPGVAMFDPASGTAGNAGAREERRISEAEVVDYFGVTPDKVVDVQALAGDSTDNVPGAPGIGIKTAAQLINEYGDLDTLLARAGEIKGVAGLTSMTSFSRMRAAMRLLPLSVAASAAGVSSSRGLAGNAAPIASAPRVPSNSASSCPT